MIPILHVFRNGELDHCVALTGTISCHVVEEKNGNFYLEMELAYIDAHFNVGSVIEVLTAENISETNLFSVISLKIDISGVYHVYAEQTTLNAAKKAVVLPIVQGQRSLLGMRTVIKNKLVFDIDFDIKMVGDKDPTKYQHGFDVPRSLKNALLGEKGSVLDVIGKGDFRWTKDHVYFHPATGEYARGKTLHSGIYSGVNLIDYTYEQSIANEYNNALAYWRDEQTGTIVIGQAYYVHDYNKCMIYDASAKYEEAPSKADLDQEAWDQYVTHSGASVSLNVKFVPNVILNGSIIQPDANNQNIEAIGMCDIIPISIPEIGLDSTVQIIKTDYNVLTGLYNSVEAGTPRKSLETALAQTAYRTGVSLFK